MTFVGIDIPAAVPKLSFTYANGKAHITWEKVATGANGAYVNPENITYTLRRGKATEIAKNLKATHSRTLHLLKTNKKHWHTWFLR